MGCSFKENILRPVPHNFPASLHNVDIGLRILYLENQQLKQQMSNKSSRWHLAQIIKQINNSSFSDHLQNFNILYCREEKHASTA